MTKLIRTTAATIMLLVVAGTNATEAHAQSASAKAPTTVISANPFGLILGLFNAELEKTFGESTTVGFGGSTFTGNSNPYVNADVYWRFYPEGTPLKGWAFGIKTGVTRLNSYSDSGNRERTMVLGFGFDVNRSWIMGKNEDIYVGTGIGLKRLFRSNGQQFGITSIPTFRLVNVGYAF